MSSNGSRPPRPRRGIRMRRPVALALGAAAALLIAGVLVAPIVILGSGSSSPPCAQTLRYQSLVYTARPVTGAVQRLAIGVGVVSGCDVPSSNVNVRSLEGVLPTRAVAVSGDASSVYVRTGLCTKATTAGLLACLNR